MYSFTLCHVTLLSFLLSSSRTFYRSLRIFSVHDHLFCTWSCHLHFYYFLFFLFFLHKPFISFSCFTVLVRISITIMRRNGESKLPLLIPYLSAKVVSFLLLMMMPLIRWRIFPSIPITIECWILSKFFFIYWNYNTYFFSFSVLMW